MAAIDSSSTHMSAKDISIPFLAQQVDDIVDLVAKHAQLARQALDL